MLKCGIWSNPRHGALWLAYATLEGRRGDVALSRQLFTKGIKNSPHHTPLLKAWASLELRDGNFLAAGVLITEALTCDKHNGAGWLVAAEIEPWSRIRSLLNVHPHMWNWIVPWVIKSQ